MLSTGLSVVVTSWEYIDRASLEQNYKFYTFASDIVSLLSIVRTASRLPTYAACDFKFRQELCRIFGCAKQSLGANESNRSLNQSEYEATPKPTNRFGAVVLETMKRRDTLLQDQEPNGNGLEQQHADTIDTACPLTGTEPEKNNRQLLRFSTFARAALDMEKNEVIWVYQF